MCVCVYIYIYIYIYIRIAIYFCAFVGTYHYCRYSTNAQIMDRIKCTFLVKFSVQNIYIYIFKLQRES